MRIPAHKEAILRARDRLASAAGKALYGERWRQAEPVFGWIKQHDGYRRATAWGVRQVRTQVLVIVIARNLRTLCNRFGVLGMREILRKLRSKAA